MGIIFPYSLLRTSRSLRRLSQFKLVKAKSSAFPGWWRLDSDAGLGQMGQLKVLLGFRA